MHSDVIHETRMLMKLRHPVSVHIHRPLPESFADVYSDLLIQNEITTKLLFLLLLLPLSLPASLQEFHYTVNWQDETMGMLLHININTQ